MWPRWSPPVGVSASRTTCPSSAASAENAIFERMAAQGQTMVAASGDEGSEDCYSPSTDQGATGLAVDDPGSQPDVLSVGGTSLVNGAVASQSVWNNCEGTPLGDCQQNGGNGATGGGYSSVWAKPTWQPVRAHRSASSPTSPPRPIRPMAWRSTSPGTAVGRPSAGRASSRRRSAGSWPTSIRAVPPPSGWWPRALRRGQRRQLHRRDDRQQRLHGDERRDATPPRPGTTPRRGSGTPEDQNLGIALQGGDGCPSVGGLERVLGAGLGRPGHHRRPVAAWPTPAKSPSAPPGRGRSCRARRPRSSSCRPRRGRPSASTSP